MERQLLCLRRIGIVFESSMGLEEALAITVEQITELMEAERSTLFIKNDAGAFVSYYLEGDEVSEISLNPGQGIAGWVAKTGKPLIIPDVYEDNRFDQSWDRKSGFRTKCIVCHPLRSARHDEIIGVVEVINKKDDTVFDEADMELLGLLAGRVALIVENLRLMVDLVGKNKSLVEAKNVLERRNRELDLLLDLEKRVAGSEDVSALMVTILKRLIDIADAEVGVLYLPDENGAEMRIVVDGEEGYRVVRVSLGTGFAGWVAAKGQELVVGSPRSDSRFTERLVERVGVIPRNLAAVPLYRRDAPALGALLVANKKNVNEGFDEPDLVLLRLVAASLADALEDLRGKEKRERNKRLAAIGRLLAGVLHDLKSPMAVVTGYAELLEETSNDASAPEYMERIRVALSRITAMSAEIIAFSKGEKALLFSSVLLDDLMKEFSRSIDPILEANNIEMVSHVRTTGAVRLDKNKMIRAFQNIVQNSVDVMQKGGTLTVEVDHLGEELVFGFTDTGGGIPEEVQGSLFQSFVTLGKEHGTGLGLAVAREIIEAHGGTISYTTVRGKGTTFLISVPSK